MMFAIKKNFQNIVNWSRKIEIVHVTKLVHKFFDVNNRSQKVKGGEIFGELTSDNLEVKYSINFARVLQYEFNT